MRLSVNDDQMEYTMHVFQKAVEATINAAQNPNDISWQIARREEQHEAIREFLLILEDLLEVKEGRE